MDREPVRTGAKMKLIVYTSKNGYLSVGSPWGEQSGEVKNKTKIDYSSKWGTNGKPESRTHSRDVKPSRL